MKREVKILPVNIYIYIGGKERVKRLESRFILYGGRLKRVVGLRILCRVISGERKQGDVPLFLRPPERASISSSFTKRRRDQSTAAASYPIRNGFEKL